MKNPVAKREKYIVKFGNVDDKRGDNLMNPPLESEDYYHWLRSDDRKNEEVLKYLNDENDYTDFEMKDYNKLTDSLYKEILSHVKEDYDSYPFPTAHAGWKSKYYYFNRNIKGKSYPIHYRINKETNKEELLIDENEMAEGRKSFDLSSFKVNDKQNLMSYGIDLNGSELYKITIIDIETRKEIEHKIPEIVYCGYFWHKGDIYYNKGDEKNRVCEVWKYDFKTQENKMLYKDDDELVSVHIHTSSNLEYFFISADSYDTDYSFYFKEDEDLKEFTKKEDNLKYSLDYHNGKFLILTNKDKSINFKLMITDEDKTSQENWKDLIPYNKDIYIDGFDLTKDFLLVSFKQNGNNFIRVIKYENGKFNIESSHIIEIEEEIKNMNLSYTTYYSDLIVYGQTSLRTPYSLYSYNLNTKETKLLRQKEVPNYDKSLYETKRINCNGHDGVSIPMSIIYKKNLFKQDGTNPLYLYGYGSYGHTVDPDFRSTIIPLLNRGFVYVIAHVRGGSFLGYEWYEDGKMKKKMNTFLDFISCAEHLINNNYTNQRGITTEGRSAGGLLVGSTLVLRPELFRTVIAGVPFVDVLNTMCDPSIPLTTQEWEQWGNPNQKEYYDYMKQYCPYTNIKENEYPNVLALAGLNDPRVAYWEPAKFVAKLRHHNKSKSLILLKTEMSQGHFGGMDRYKYIKELAFTYSYVLKTYNLYEDC